MCLGESCFDHAPKYDQGTVADSSGESAMLSKFQGNPGKLSPKARIHLWAGKLFPSKFK